MTDKTAANIGFLCKAAFKDLKVTLICFQHKFLLQSFQIEQLACIKARLGAGVHFRAHEKTTFRVRFLFVGISLPNYTTAGHSIEFKKKNHTIM